MSTATGIEATEQEKQRDKELDKQLKEVRTPKSSLRHCQLIVNLVHRQKQKWLSKSKYLFHSKTQKHGSLMYFQVLLLGSGDSGKSTILKVGFIVRYHLGTFQHTPVPVANATYPQASFRRARDRSIPPACLQQSNARHASAPRVYG